MQSTPSGTPAGGGNLGRHLGRRQDPAETGLGALTQLDLQRPHGCAGNEFSEPVQAEPALFVTAAEVCGSDLEDQVATSAMVWRDPALAGVVQTAGKR